MALDVAAAPTPITAEQLESWPESDERVELVRGRVVTMAPAGFEHGLIAATIFHALRSFVVQRKLGQVVFSETGFVIARDPDTVRAPDVAFVAADRVSGIERRSGYFPGPPDLAVEVVSPTDTNEAVEDKVLDYLDAGVRQVWVVSPRHRTLHVFESRQSARILGPGDTLEGGDLLPGLSLRVGELFPE